MDPQQRLMLEVAWQAFEDAALAPDRRRGSATGVFVGVSNAAYARILLRDPLAVEAPGVTGSALSIVANRLSRTDRFRSVTGLFNTACSASLIGACGAKRRS